DDRARSSPTRGASSIQALPDETVDLGLVKERQGWRRQDQPTAHELEMSFLLCANQIRERAQLEVVNDKMLAFVDFVESAVADVSFEAGLDFLWRGFPQVVRGESRAIGAH